MPKRFVPRADANLVGIIGDEDTVTGFVLAGCGNVDSARRKNFFVVDSKTPLASIEETFRSMVTRGDIAVLLITQTVADEIRPLIAEFDGLSPAIVEIPGKGMAYDPSRDWIGQRVKGMFSNRD